MSAKLRLKLTERGSSAIIPRAKWDLHNAADEVFELFRVGIIGYSESPGYVVITPRTYVGSYDSRSLQIVIESKAPLFTDILVQMLDQWRKRVSHIDITAKDSVGISSNLLLDFEALLEGVLTSGLPWRYKKEEHVTCFPRGKLNVRKTITEQLAKGALHKVVTRISRKQFYSDFRSALETVKTHLLLICRPYPADSDKLMELLHAMGDQAKPCSSSDALDIFLEIAQEDQTSEIEALCGFCISLLRDEKPWIKRFVSSSSYAEFIDLERLWENAIHVYFDKVLAGHGLRVALHPLSKACISYLINGSMNIDPDILVHSGEHRLGVADAKYKVASSPISSDLYQIGAYTARLNCRIGFLVYLAHDNIGSIQRLGGLGCGAEIYAIYLGAVDFISIDIDGGAVAREIARLFNQVIN
jgi:5-methylcytosine-specific restriction endonuclease McrBC regulatory subunit McrC